jgi:hypothetical protein
MTDKHFITVMEGMNGFFGVHVWLNEEEEDIGPFWEPYERSFRTHPTREEAEVEAQQWAEDMEMEYRA